MAVIERDHYPDNALNKLDTALNDIEKLKRTASTAGITTSDVSALIAAHAADSEAHHATIPDATETVKGIAELATTTEAQTGTATTLIVTPAGLRADVPATPAASRGVRLDASGNLAIPAGGRITTSLFNIGAGTDALFRIQGSATNTVPLANIGSGSAAYDAEKASGYVIGVGMQPNVNATGDLSFVYGGYMYAGVTIATGKTVTKVAGMYIESAGISGAGAVTTLCGLYIAAQSGATTNYGLYQAGSNTNYFGGVVSIGTTATTNSKLTVESGISIKDGVTAPGTSSGYAQIYVDTADGDLKVKFGDGTVKVLAADT